MWYVPSEVKVRCTGMYKFSCVRESLSYLYVPAG